MIDNMHHMAMCYFRGEISAAEEATLFEALNSDSALMDAFREWEQDWFSEQGVNLAAEQEWRTFSRTLVNANETKNYAWALSRWVRNAAVALALVTFSSVATYMATRHSTEEYYSMTAPEGSKSEILLPDGTKVWLNAGSTLRYGNSFCRHHRKVELTGEGYFEVAKHGKREFVVHTAAYDVTVKGTKFNVSAYNEDEVTSTALVEGRVNIDHNSAHLEMLPGEMVKYNKRTGELTKTTYNTNAQAWMNNMSEYEDITLNDFARVLSRQYAVNIHIASAELGSSRFAISLRNKETIDDVLVALQRITGMEIKRTGKEIRISK